MGSALVHFKNELARLWGAQEVDAAVADATAQLLVREYPLTRRLGPAAMEDRLLRLGLEKESAREASLELWAFELLGRASYRSVHLLMEDTYPEGEVRAACLVASRYRRTASQNAIPAERSPLAAKWLRRVLQWWKG